MLSRNEVTLHDFKLYGQPVKNSYTESRIDYSVVQQMSDDLGNKNSYISMYVMLDDSYKSVTRQIFTFANAASLTGGFMTVIFLVTLILVQRVQQTIYFSSLIKSFYKYQPELLSDPSEFQSLDRHSKIADETISGPE